MYDLNQILALIQQPFQPVSGQVTNFHIDSREMKPKGLFLALKGEHVDGHDMLQNAKENGAISAIVEKTYKGPCFGLYLIKVDDVLATLHLMAKNRLKQLNSPKIIGVTGSAGKTTTKEFLATILEGSYRVAKSPKSYNSQRTFPLNILNFPKNAEILVLEMGISLPGEMQKLIEIAPPDIALITCLSKAHIGNFPNGFKELVEEKTTVFSHPNTQVVIASEETLLKCSKRALENKRVISCASAANKTADITLFQEKGHVYIQEQNSPVIEIKGVPFTESHLLEDLLMAISVSRQLGLSWELIQKQIPLLKSVERRFEKLIIDDVLYINDTYNASPDSVLLALNNLPKPHGSENKTICVLGEMRELGEHAKEAYQSVATLAVEKADQLLSFGENTKPLIDAFHKANKKAHVFSEKIQIAKELKKITRKGDVVLVKGVNTQKLWELFSYL